MNCYIRKQILYFARQIDEQRKVSSANRFSASVEAVALAETIVTQINTMLNTFVVGNLFKYAVFY